MKNTYLKLFTIANIPSLKNVLGKNLHVHQTDETKLSSILRRFFLHILSLSACYLFPCIFLP